VNFSVFANKAVAIELLLFDHADAGPAQVFRWTRRSTAPTINWQRLSRMCSRGRFTRTARSVLTSRRRACPSTREGAGRPYGPRRGHARRLRPAAASRPGDNAATAMKSVVVDSAAYDWEGDSRCAVFCCDGGLRDARPRLHASPQFRCGGREARNYAGLIEKIPYLQNLGVTAVELLPIYQFDPTRRRPA